MAFLVACQCVNLVYKNFSTGYTFKRGAIIYCNFDFWLVWLTLTYRVTSIVGQESCATRQVESCDKLACYILCIPTSDPHMPNIWLKYAPPLTHICSPLTHTCSPLTHKCPPLTHIYAQPLTLICLTSDPYMPNIRLKYVPPLPQICPTSDPHTPHLWTAYAPPLNSLRPTLMPCPASRALSWHCRSRECSRASVLCSRARAPRRQEAYRAPQLLSGE